MPTKPPIGSASATTIAVWVPTSPASCALASLAYAFLMEGTPQRPHRILAHPSAIDVEGELEALLEDRGRPP